MRDRLRKRPSANGSGRARMSSTTACMPIWAFVAQGVRVQPDDLGASLALVGVEHEAPCLI
jgi:hypothetical protein